ncbi:phosphodiesterase [Streptomyces sp. GESEQ-13]|uniref:phosphodiesterase n=1 Tax=Streptomyces sp. GESEQ-13 TaxID=2812654 RepID=UPI00307C4683
MSPRGLAFLPGVREAAHRAAERVARWRDAPAVHPTGVLCSGTLHVAGHGERPWGVDWLDRHASYAAIVRWSQALGTPGRLPDALGLAVRVEDAGGPDRPLDLLFTSSGTGRLGRHVPLLRPDALTGAYSTLLTYRTGECRRVLAAFPLLDPPHTPRPTLWQELACRPVLFRLCAAAGDELWRPFASLTLEALHPARAQTTVSYDPVAHSLPGLRPAGRLNRLRDAAYAGSRRGRGAA